MRNFEPLSKAERVQVIQQLRTAAGRHLPSMLTNMQRYEATVRRFEDALLQAGGVLTDG